MEVWHNAKLWGRYIDPVMLFKAVDPIVTLENKHDSAVLHMHSLLLQSGSSKIRGIFKRHQRNKEKIITDLLETPVWARTKKEPGKEAEIDSYSCPQLDQDNIPVEDFAELRKAKNTNRVEFPIWRSDPKPNLDPIDGN